MWLKNDKKRYRYLVCLHTISTITFTIRFIVLCTDLSAANSDSIVFPVIILLLELGSSFIILVANFIYVFLRYIGSIIFESDGDKVGCCSQSFAWNLATLTCFRCECYQEHPQLILLTRFCILILFEIMRFIAFILACISVNRHRPIGLGYAIVAGFSLVPSFVLLVVEYLHYHRLWFHYRPNTSSEETPSYDNRHQRFIPMTMTNDQQTSHWQKSRCTRGENCSSQSLYHAVMYHSGNTRYSPDRTNDNQIVVGFHQTSHVAAYSIAKTSLKPSEDGWIGPGIYFATSLNHTQFKANQFGAYVCAQVDLGKTQRINNPKVWRSVAQCDTVYYQHPSGADEFCVRNPQQIRSWIIVIDDDPNVRFLRQRNMKSLPSGNYVEDQLEHKDYYGCWI